MRPQILFPLFADVTSLPGLGPRLGKLVHSAIGPHVADLLWHLPSGIIDRSYAPTLAEVLPGRIATLMVRITEHQPPLVPRRPYRVLARDATGEMELVFFHTKGDYLAKLLPLGETRLVSGRVEIFQGRPQMTHPDYIAKPEEAAEVTGIETVYPLTAGLNLKTLRKAVRAALDRVPALPEWGNGPYLARQGWPAFQAALETIHAPRAEADLSPETPARTRLAYDELLANQLALALIRAHQKKQSGRVIQGDGRLRAKVEASLPFALTGGQRQALADIAGDMGAPKRMLRLLQGDVGSGKTIVALMAMLSAVEAGGQAALLAPTEILARQHAATLARVAAPAGVTVALLTGREKGKNREAILAGLASGGTGIVVGTHALLQEDVAFSDLMLAVVDEQHRFGVHQRVVIGAKGRGVDVLVMTATPIPRTLTLTAYGDLDVSRLTEKPAGRKPITTIAKPTEAMEEVVAGVTRAMNSGAKVYWVCPLVEESEVIDVAAAEERHAHLSQLFGARVGLVHGRMKGADKDRVMAAFSQGPVDLLVSTTVIEVGVDVPAATVIVIEHAERFGLAQLHQLRGRIGRGDKPSTCILLYQKPLSETAESRLRIMRETEDGFVIAEEDLRLRGAGEVLGTRQSGLPTFRVADMSVHGELLEAVRDDARLVLDRDPELQGERGKALRILLYLFERDAAVRYLRSG
ncbi:ATP-dependent DNA helicase RecG [Oceanibaculum pacificum]|uniref:ATP-dependent DNA helicase RecG n=1 Tax=Oceanibaculum pacificum TaxID=580166 RepID=A0A154VR66_9PROT|nr:ATP-dependent DNA helicase RecG [Oceanibaculum pacificum]KZD03721.1 ATP-dependent DNA helicase RecG [Oceanibaculum pacificum]